MRVLVTGVKGQLGHDIVNELKKRGYNDIRGIDIDDLDLTIEEDVRTYIREYHPDVIMHNAAYTMVDKAEDNFEICKSINALAVKYISEAAKEINAKLVYISTDYVFDGTKDGLYEVDDEKNPKSVYGLTKSMGEDYALKNEKTFVVRISWVFGINGNNFIKTMLRLSETKSEISVVSDQIGSPTYTYDLSRLLVDMIETEKYGVYHATNEGFCSWYEFAVEIFKTAGVNMKVNPILAKDYPAKADRPMNSRMSKKALIDNGFKLLPSWQEALKAYITEMRNK